MDHCFAAGDSELRDRLRQHIEFLADDALRGREPGTEGYNIAARYVANQFQQMGLAPAGNAGRYFQSVPLRRAWLDQQSVHLELIRGQQQHTLNFADHFHLSASLAHTSIAVEAGMVFVGYGIHAPALGIDDYQGVDLQGKVAVMVAGKPIGLPNEEGAHFGSSRVKIGAALDHGAVAVMTLFTPRTERVYSWDKVRSSATSPSMAWLDASNRVPDVPEGLLADLTLRHTAAEPLFEGSGVTVQAIIDADQNGEPLPGASLTGRLKIAHKSRHELIESPNVVAMLPGSDPLLSSEFLVYTAHLDHLGLLDDDDRDDVINNGAMDNAAGISVMLEAARMLSQGKPPGRSVLFLAVTAEEKGLVGSGYFAQNPTVPSDQLVAVINLDMPMLLYDFADVVAFGAEHSSLGRAVQKAASEAGLELAADPYPDQSIFVRSDHYRFVQQGIPSIYLAIGPTAGDGVSDNRPLFEDFLKNHYHTPSDEADLPIHYFAAEKFTRINARVGEILAHEQQRPYWYADSFFGQTFATP